MANLRSTEVDGNLTVTGEAVVNNRNVLDEIDELNTKLFPIGSIYMSIKSTNPSNLFGGTWKAWGTGRVPIGIDTSQTEFATVEKTGGSKTHRHTQSLAFTDEYINTNGLSYTNGGTVPKNATYTGYTSNLPPYITCYMWVRTA